MSPARALRFTLRLLLRTNCSATLWLAARSAILAFAAYPRSHQLPLVVKQAALLHGQPTTDPTPLKLAHSPTSSHMPLPAAHQAVC